MCCRHRLPLHRHVLPDPLTEVRFSANLCECVHFRQARHLRLSTGRRRIPPTSQVRAVFMHYSVEQTRAAGIQGRPARAAPTVTLIRLGTGGWIRVLVGAGPPLSRAGKNRCRSRENTTPEKTAPRLAFARICCILFIGLTPCSCYSGAFRGTREFDSKAIRAGVR